jgi:hypothetical protein
MLQKYLPVARRPHVAAALLALLAFCRTAPLSAQEPPGRMVGRVVDHSNGKALSGARVTILNTQLNAITDNNGAFTLANVPAGEDTLLVELIGYEPRRAPIRVPARETVEAEIRLATRPIALPPLEVTVRSGRLEAAGFYDRRLEFGRQARFMDRSVIEKRNPQLITDLFYNQSGIQVMYGGAGSRLIRVNRNGGCSPNIYIDGNLVDNRDLDTSRPEVVEGIEVYIGALIPIQYKTMTDCGVILIWTRRGSR